MGIKYQIHNLGEEAVTFSFDQKSIQDHFDVDCTRNYSTKLTNILAKEVRETVFNSNQLSTTSADNNNTRSITDCICSFTTLTIFYNPEVIELEAVICYFDEILTTILNKDTKNKQTEKACRYNIPSCYEIEDDNDLTEIANQLGISTQKVIELHSKPTYKVDLIGFTPGFPFCTKVDQRLALNRKKTPRVRMHKGDIAIVQDKTVIYPHQSPGGWNVVARTPVKIFDIVNDSPVCFKFGDEINFQKISLEQYSNLLVSRVNLSKCIQN